MNQHISIGMPVITSLLILALGFGAANADELHVPSDKYSTISAALEAAFAGDKVIVAAGRYEENITIDILFLELIGAGEDRTTIVGKSSWEPVVKTDQDRVTVRDLTIEGGSHGISFDDVGAATIQNVTIRNVGSHGINLRHSSPNLNNVNIIGSKECGIYSWGSRSDPKIRSCIITQNGKDGVHDDYRGDPDLGTEADPGNNEIYANRGFHINTEDPDIVQAIGNWWGADPPDERFFNGQINYEPWLTEPPLSSLPKISSIAPGRGSVSGGMVITITGSRFVDGATITVNGNSATHISVDSEIQITASAPSGTAGPAVVTVTNPDGKSTSKESAFEYVDDERISIVQPSSYQVELALTAGLNIFSLPLRSETPITASKLASDLGATVVIRAFEGQFQAYVADGIGTNFPISVGEGFIVNLLEAKTYSLAGLPWGTPVSPAPTTPIAETWAFVIAGRIDGHVSGGERLCATNLRTGESVIVPVSPSGESTAAFVDMSRRSVLAADDEIVIQLIGSDGFPLTEARRYRISQEQITRACLLTRLCAVPEKTRLLQNYPNPFNPETWIPYQLSEDLRVTIRIYNANGQLIRLLNLGYMEASWYVTKDRAAYWDGITDAGEHVSSGIYFYNIQAGNYSTTRKMMITR